MESRIHNRGGGRVKVLIFLALITGATCLADIVQGESLSPVYEYNEALALSRQTGKSVLLDFYFDT